MLVAKIPLHKLDKVFSQTRLYSIFELACGLMIERTNYDIVIFFVFLRTRQIFFLKNFRQYLNRSVTCRRSAVWKLAGFYFLFWARGGAVIQGTEERERGKISGVGRCEIWWGTRNARWQDRIGGFTRAADPPQLAPLHSACGPRSPLPFFLRGHSQPQVRLTCSQQHNGSGFFFFW
jgi:hypothetical protein